MTARYRTSLASSQDGSATFGTAERFDGARGRFVPVGETRRFRAYPASVRARDAAERLCRKDAEARGINPREISLDKV